MADRQMRADGWRESLIHCAVIAVAVVTVYVLGGVVGDGAIAATRYFTG